MIGVIYARYSSDNQREESIEGSFGSAVSMRTGTVSLCLIRTSTVPILRKRIIVRVS